MPVVFLFIMHQMKIGENCIIVWNCQFLDEDYHELQYEGKKEKDGNIIIGNNIWIGSNCFIYKGVFILDGCVIAASSVVRSGFSEKNALIGGKPARILRSTSCGANNNKADRQLETKF